jgi:phage terminase large subunit-like protein
MGAAPSRIGGEPLRLEAEALFGALQHISCGAHFGLADRARGFNIHDHTALDVDQIVVGISEERRPFEGAGPLRRWVGGRYELQLQLRRCPERRVVECGKIFLHRPTCSDRIDLLLPLVPRDRALTVGIGFDQAGINGEALAADQTSLDTRSQHALKHATEDIALTEALIAGARERRVVRYGLFVVAVDPAVSTSEGSDETGIVACGIDEAGRFYVIDDQSGRYAPHEWAQRAITTYRRWSADRIVIEANQGGAMVQSTLRHVDPNVPIRTVNASRGKVTRAEPVSV